MRVALVLALPMVLLCRLCGRDDRLSVTELAAPRAAAIADSTGGASGGTRNGVCGAAATSDRRAALPDTPVAGTSGQTGGDCRIDWRQRRITRRAGPRAAATAVTGGAAGAPRDTRRGGAAGHASGGGGGTRQRRQRRTPAAALPAHCHRRHDRHRRHDGTGGTTGTGGARAGRQPERLVQAGVPTKGQPADVSSPTTVVGTGTAASCTFAALQTRRSTTGGVITFNCGRARSRSRSPRR